MPLTLFDRTLQRVAVIGSGNVGPDIALFLSRVLAPHGVPVVVNDVVQDALDAGRTRVRMKLERGVESSVFRLGDVEQIEKNLVFTMDKSILTGCDFVIEAATEKLEVKQRIFDEVERLVPPHAILASNSSHLEPERIFEKVRRPERTMVHHFFYPVERNPLVELVPGPKTRITDWCLRFYEALGKVPIRVKSRYGFAINPVFEGVFLAAALIEEEGTPAKIIDSIACRVFRHSLGPFTAMNLKGGNPLTQIGLNTYREKIMPWFRSPASLDQRVATGQSWQTIDKGDTVSYSNAMYEDVSGKLLGAYFGLACEVLESGIVNLGDLELGVAAGLGMRPPFALMNDLGHKKVRQLIETYAAANPGFKVPREFGPWKIPLVFREDRDDVAVLTIKRPRQLNALTRETYRQLADHLGAIREDPKIRGVVLTGFGVKAFVSGADVKMLAGVASKDEARKTSTASSEAVSLLESLGKPVVCALNGLSLGGGSELAYACTARIARKGLSTLFGQPEVKLGIIPGSGGTQRLPRLIDFETAWRLLRTGATVSGEEALRLGLISEEVDGDLVKRAAELARELKPAPLPAPSVPKTLPEVDLGGLSRRIDEILRKAILQGASMPLELGLAFESECFAECFETRDCRIGLENFAKTHLKQPAPFIHG